MDAVSIPSALAVTKEVCMQGAIAYTQYEFDTCLKLITDNSENHALILDGKDGKTRFIINNTEAIIDGEYWTMDGFNKII